MSVIRTSLSLISFGFTIYQMFTRAHEAGILQSSVAASSFGRALVLLGTLMLGLGIVYHLPTTDFRHALGEIVQKRLDTPNLSEVFPAHTNWKIRSVLKER